jgi:hypothetical protein
MMALGNELALLVQTMPLVSGQALQVALLVQALLVTLLVVDGHPLLGQTLSAESARALWKTMVLVLL